VDGTFFIARRGPKVGQTRRGKGMKDMILVDGEGTPKAGFLDSEAPAEPGSSKRPWRPLRISTGSRSALLRTKRMMATVRGVTWRLGRSSGLSRTGRTTVGARTGREEAPSVMGAEEPRADDRVAGMVPMAPHPIGSPSDETLEVLPCGLRANRPQEGLGMGSSPANRPRGVARHAYQV